MEQTSKPDRVKQSSLVSAAIIVGALYLGRDILLPFALSVLLSFLLAPLVDILEKSKFGRLPAVLSVVSVAVLSFVTLAFVSANQVYDLAYKLPDYRENILAKARTIQGDGTGVVARLTDSVDEMRASLSESRDDERRSRPPEDIKQPMRGGDRRSYDAKTATFVLNGDALQSPEKPLRVEVVQGFSASEIARNVLGPLISPLASAAIVIVFLIFILLKREDLRNRFLQLIGGDRLNVTTQALGDAARRINRYLLMQLIINSTYGLVIFVGLLLIGLPNALLWGALAALLRFLPYVGPWMAALMPITISLAVFDTWLQPALVFSLFIVNELVSNNFIEPWLYGSSTGISTIGILVSAVFWTWLWGPLGLVLATPLTVCLTVGGRYVPQLAFLHTMLSDQEMLPPHSRFYQRLLALDADEAMQVVEDYLASSTLVDLYDQVLLPALSLAERDRHQGELDEEKEQFVQLTMREIVEELGERVQKRERGSSADPDRVGSEEMVLCLPARDDADEIAGLMLVQLLAERGIAARVASSKLLSGEMIEQITVDKSIIVCISALPPFAVTHARYLCRRIRPRFPQLKVVLGLWQTGEMAVKTRERLATTGIDRLETTLKSALMQLETLVQNNALFRESVPK